MKIHWLWMVIGCGLPLLFIFLAPSLGIGGGTTLFTFIIVMFAIHLLMPHGSHGHGGHNHSQKRKAHEQGSRTSSNETKEDHKGHQHH